MTSTSVTFDIIGRDRSGSAAFDKVAKSANRADGAMSKFSAGAMKVVKAGGLAAVAAGGFAVKLGIDAVGAASDLNETLNKSAVIFGKHADGMAAWAGRADQSMGLSQQAALAAAAGFGDMFSQIGFTGDQAVKMSKDVVQLSADLGSFNNLETADVAERMSAAFRGEFDSLQALIPNINAARVESQALATTGKKTADALTAQEKAAAVLAIVTKDGARAQGDFARTSDGLANQTKILKAQLDNASASFGQKLLPMAVDFANFANTELVPAIEKGADWLGERLPGAIDTVVDAGRDLRDAVAPAVEEIAEALGNLAGEGDTAGKAFDAFVDVVREASEVVGAVVDFIDDLPGPIKDIGIQAAFAAAVVPRLTGAIGGFVAGAQDAERRSAALKTGIANLAGVGGMLLLVQSTREANDSLALLESTAGGALAGFSVGGPWGAALGGAAGAVVGLQGPINDLADKWLPEIESAVPLVTREFEDASVAADDFADSLDGVTGAVTGATRGLALQALQQADVISTGRDLGLTQRELIDAVLGVPGAMRKVTGALLDQQMAGGLADRKFAHFASTLGLTAEELRAAQREVRNTARATQELAGKLDGVPKDVRIQVKEHGIPVTLRGLSSLAREHKDLNNKQLKILIEAADLPFTVKQVRNFGKQVRGLPDRVQSRISAPGVDLTARQVANLNKRYKLTPDRVRTLMRAEGIPTTLRGLAGLRDRYGKIPKSVRTLIEAADLPITVKQIRNFQKDIETTDRKSAKPKVGIKAEEWIRGYAATRRDLGVLDKDGAQPNVGLDLSNFFTGRSTVISSLNTIPDEEVTVWVTRRNRNGNGFARGTSSAPPGWAWVGEEGAELVKFKGGEQVLPHSRSMAMAASMERSPASFSSAVRTAPAAPGYRGQTVKHVIEVRVVGGELDLTKAKVQLDGIAREVARDEIRDERAWLRTQE